MFGQLLVEFLFRLTFGIATAMALTPSRLVTSGFFRVHLWVLLGLQTLAALAAYSAARPLAGKAAHDMPHQLFTLAVLAAVLSYLGSIIWMYEERRLGKLVIWGIAAACLVAGWWSGVGSSAHQGWRMADFATGGILLGFVTTAMLLGHWYLNTPTMKLEPLRRLLLCLGGAIVIRMIVSGSGAWLQATTHLETAATMPASTWSLFLILRWSAGLISVAGLTWLTWQTLKIPNTQSATGILYAAVILTLIGELTSQLLSAESTFPV